MNHNENRDRQFDENLRKFAARLTPPPALSDGARERCLAQLDGGVRRVGMATRVIRHPACRWTMGMAASIGLVAAVAISWGSGSSAEAAMIFERLDEQIAVENPVLEIALDSVGIDEVEVDGHLYVSKTAIAGDVKVRIENDGETIDIDATLAISGGEGWILIRRLVVPDPQAQAVVNIFLPPGGDALLILPKDEIDHDFGLDIAEALEKFSSKEVIEVLKQIIDNRAEVGASVVDQRDGTIQLTVPIKTTESLGSILQIVARSLGQAEDGDVELDGGEGAELVGSTFIVTFDPKAQRVRSLKILDLGGSTGSISISIGEGEIDPDLLDSAKFITPQTRVIDLAAIAGMIKRFED